MAALAARLVDAVVSSNIALQFLRFLGVGGSATLLMYALLAIQVELLNWPAVLSSTLAYCLSAVFNYWANYHFTFASEAGHRHALPRFAAIATCGLAINAAIMQLLVHTMAWHYLLAQISATLAVLLWNFFANRHWTYRSHHTSSQG